jgi:hypothetical protein
VAGRDVSELSEPNPPPTASDDRNVSVEYPGKAQELALNQHHFEAKSATSEAT